MKTIAVIGPHAEKARRVAETLTGVRAIAGAGPNDGIDGVIAVVGEATEDNLQVARAVAESMGTLIVASDATWPDIPGVHYCPPDDAASLEGLAATLWVDKPSWEAEARRADLKRAEQAKIAIRLRMQKVMKDLLRDPLKDKECSTAVHREFLVELKIAILSQGIICPHIADTAPEPADPVDAPGITAQLAALAAGVLGVAGLFFAVGRVAGYPWLGLGLGALLAVTVGWLRYSTLRRQMQEAQQAADAHALKQTWGQLLTDVLARVQLPRVADQVARPQGEN